MIAIFASSVSGRAALGLPAALLAVAMSVWLAPPAEAATLALPGNRENQAWFWSSNADVRQCSPPLPEPLPPDRYCTPQAYDLSPASPISPGHLGVSLRNGQSDMRTYVFFDTFEIPAEATVSKFVLQLTVSRPQGDPEHTTERHGHQGSKAPATTNEDRASIKACLVTLTWGRTEGGAPSTMNPDDPTKTEPVEPAIRNGIDCSVSVEGKGGAKWTFDLTEMAERWMTGKSPNNGVALLPQPTGPTDSWTVEFHGGEYSQTVEDPTTGGTAEDLYVSRAEASRVVVTYTVPAPTPPPVVDFGPDAPPAAPPLPPAEPPPLEPAPTDPGTQPQPQTGPPLGESNPVTPWYVWMLLPGFAAGMAGLSRAVGREIGEAGANRVASVVRRRHAETAGD